jgi:aryl-alcohol dehydrogenase-like predicted oxidoreductase
MRTRQLGAGGPDVSAVGFGCLSFGGIFGATTPAESLAALDAAWDQGITFFDTANVYGNGVAEEVLGEWLRTRKHPAIVATKAAFARDRSRRIDNSPGHLRHELEGSLRRLGADHVALFYAHRHDPSVPAEELAGTMAGLVQAGLIGGYGLSEVAPYTVERAHAVHPVRAVQNEYSLWTRQAELGLIQRCAALGIAFVPFAPLARGAFGQAILDPAMLAPDEFRRRIPRFQPENWPENRRKIERFRALAGDLGVTPPALALAWVLDRGAHVVPIPGTRHAAHVRDWAGAADLTMTEAMRQAIATILPVGWAWGDRYDDAQAATVERYS